MSAKLHGRRFSARVTPQHNSLIAKDVALPEERRNKVPNLRAAALRWYACTTAPSRELSAAASVRATELHGARAGEQPFAAYVPCEFFWHRAVRSNLRVPRREHQRPIMRHYLFVGVLGGLCDVTMAALRDRDSEGRNAHGLVGILGISGIGPIAMSGEALAWLRQHGDDEIAGRTNRSVAGAIQPGESVRAGSGMFSGFLGQFIGTDEGGTVGVLSLEMMGSRCDIRLPIEDVHRAA
jgi:transcriptional antiterminator NusG